MADDLLILFKDPPSAGEDATGTSLTYQEAASHCGWARCGFVPVLSFAPENEDALRSLLPSFQASYRGLIVTSQQAAACFVDAFKDASSSSSSSSSSPSIPCLVVGEKSKILLSTVISEGSIVTATSAELLVPLLIEASSSSSTPPWLFLVGDKRLDTIPSALTHHGIAFQELRVYSTCSVKRDAIMEGVRKALLSDSSLSTAAAAQGGAGGTRRMGFVFFSPSGVTSVFGGGDSDTEGKGEDGGAAVPSVLELTSSPPPFLIAIGKTTASALASRGLPVAAVCPTPDPAGLLAALESLEPKSY
jgi:uroporphyrinogen-III synthase